MLEIDEIIHQPVRTKILAFLANQKEVDYTTLKKSLELTDGHMSTHMKKLIQAKYVTVKKEFVENKPRTSYKLSSLGKKSLAIYLENLKRLIS